MKRFKIGFLALIALAAMSFTISENAGFFKKAVAESTVCYRGVDVRLNCSDATTSFIELTSSCPGEVNGLQNYHVWGLTLTSPYNLVNGGKPSECGSLTSKFCCVTIDEDESPCVSPNTQPLIDIDGPGGVAAKKYKVIKSYCRPNF